MTAPLPTWTDEQLNAFLDGELYDDTCAAIERDLERDTDLAGRLEALAAANAAIAHAFDAPLDQPVPERHLAAIEAGFAAREAQAAAPRQDGNVTAFRLRPRPADGAPARTAPARPASERAARWATPIAAGLALVIGAAGGLFAGQGLVPAPGAPAGETVPLLQVAAALEDAPSSSPLAVSGGTLQPVLSFRAADGRFCREFQWSKRGDAFSGIACKSDGQWGIEVMIAGAPAASGEGFTQASGAGGMALEAALSALGAGEPLSAEDEARAMAGDWSPAS